MKHSFVLFTKLFVLFIYMFTIGCSASFVKKVKNTPIQTQKSTIEPIPNSTVLPKWLYSKGQISFVYWNGKSDIYLINLENGEFTNLTTNLTSSTDPALSSDGQFIAFTSHPDLIPQIYTMKTDGSEIKQLTFGKEGSYDPVWSPTGEHIIFLSERDNILSSKRGVPVPEVYIMKSDGSEQKRLTDNQDMNESALSWAPKGDIITASIGDPSISRHSREIYLLDLHGVIQKRLTESGNNYSPKWSPNGEFITYFSFNQNNCSGINIMRANGSDKKCLIIDKASPPIQNRDPSWSPNGEYIIFSSNLDGDFNLYIVKADGSGLTRLTNLPGDETSPGWAQKP
jgi:TolB protein